MVKLPDFGRLVTSELLVREQSVSATGDHGCAGILITISLFETSVQPNRDYIIDIYQGE
jgi:hypothetical protein